MDAAAGDGHRVSFCAALVLLVLRTVRVASAGGRGGGPAARAGARSTLEL